MSRCVLRLKSNSFCQVNLPWSHQVHKKEKRKAQAKSKAAGGRLPHGAELSEPHRKQSDRSTQWESVRFSQSNRSACLRGNAPKNASKESPQKDLEASCSHHPIHKMFFVVLVDESLDQQADKKRGQHETAMSYGAYRGPVFCHPSFTGARHDVSPQGYSPAAGGCRKFR